MRLRDLIEAYIRYKRSLGMRFVTDAAVLRAFGRALGDIDVVEAKPAAVKAYIAGRGLLNASWLRRLKTLRGFYRYALARGLTSACPLPSTLPRLSPPVPPYIYSVDELKGLLAATATLQSPGFPLRALTVRTLLLLLYGTGMRVGEALSLSLRDVDVAGRLLTIRESKFFKTRLVPIDQQLTAELAAYAHRRRRLPRPAGEASAFFATRTGTRLKYAEVGRLFRRMRRLAGIQREGGVRYQPRLHDLRHTAASHRLIAWYRNGADVQRLLPQLATYLGHVNVGSTQRYLTVSAELLHEASLRFERYAQPEVNRA